MTEKKARKLYQDYLDSKPEDPLMFGQWCLQTARYEDLKPHVDKVIAKNTAFIKADNEMVTDEYGQRVPLNPEYVERARVTREYKERMKNYTGSGEIGSDLLFDMKKRSDESGDDFIKMVKAETDRITGDWREDKIKQVDNEFKPKPKKKKWWQRLFRSKCEMPERLSVQEMMEWKK